MKKLGYLLFMLLLPAFVMVGCDKGGDDSGTPYAPPAQEERTQEAFANETNTGGGFSFSANTSWTAAVTPSSAPAGRASINPGLPITPGNQVVWLKLYNGTTEAYSGGAGQISLTIVLDENYTDEDREATITISVGGNSFTVTVRQNAKKEDGSKNPAPIAVTSVAVNKTELSLEKGEEEILTATVLPANATIKSVVWVSDDTSVATVDPVSGKVTAIAKGTATITAISSSATTVSGSCALTVTESYIKVTSIKLNETSKSMAPGATFQLSVTEVQPANATDKTVAWSTSNATVATVGNDGLVTIASGAQAGQTATITATANDGSGKTATCLITVTGEVASGKLLKKITSSYQGPGGPSTNVVNLSYDAGGRLLDYTNDDFDGPGTTRTATYTYSSGKIAGAYVYTNGDGPGKGSIEYTLNSSGYATAYIGTWKQDDETEDEASEDDATYIYNASGQLTSTTEYYTVWYGYNTGPDEIAGGRSFPCAGSRVSASSTYAASRAEVVSKDRRKSVATLGWTGGNLTSVDTKEYSSDDDTPFMYERQHVAYGSDKCDNFIVLMSVLDVYIPGLTEPLNIFGKFGKYLPTKIESYDWYANESNPSTPGSTTTYAYQFTDELLTKATITTVLSDGDGYTETVVFEYE